MKLSEKEREELIVKISNHAASQALSDKDFLLDVFVIGWKGYEDYTDYELIEEAASFGLASLTLTVNGLDFTFTESEGGEV